MNISNIRLLNQQLVAPEFTNVHDLVAYMGMLQAQEYKMMRWAVGIRMKRPSMAAFRSAYNSGRIVRTHGGARSVEYVVGTDDLLLNRNTRNVEAKTTIARKAKELVRPDSTVFLDSGSTTTALARELDDVRTLIFTNSLTCAAELARLEHARTIMIGGTLNRYSLSLNGSKSIEDINSLNFDLLFLGVTSFQSSTGFACGSDDEAALKRALIAHAEKTVVLMDSSKLGQRSTFKICDLADVDYVVSDGNLTEHFKKYCEEAEVTVL